MRRTAGGSRRSLRYAGGSTGGTGTGGEGSTEREVSLNFCVLSYYNGYIYDRIGVKRACRDVTAGNSTTVLEYLMKKEIPVKCGVCEASEKSERAIRKNSRVQ